MFIIQLLEFSLFFVIHTGFNLTTSKEQRAWFESFGVLCRLNALQNVKELNDGKIWSGGLFLQTPWMIYKGCFNDNGLLRSAVHQTIDRRITISCSYKCREHKYYALKDNLCTCLDTTSNMSRVDTANCSHNCTCCNSSKKHHCGDTEFYTVYEYTDMKSLQTTVSENYDIKLCSSKITNTTSIENANNVENLTPYWTSLHRQHVLKWTTKDKRSKEGCYIMEDLLNVTCVSVNEGMQYVPMSCKRIACPGLCESTTNNTMTNISAKCEGSYLTTSKTQMNWFESFNYCKLSTLKTVKELNVTNVWLGGLYLQTPWMVHRGCFYNIEIWDTPAYPHSHFECNITSGCSYKCRKTKYFALKANLCICLNSLFNMMETKMDNCKIVCNGSKKDPCGDARFLTVYEQEDTNATDFENFHKVENGTTYIRRPLIKWIMDETFAEIINETADFHNVKCLLLNENLQYVPTSCKLNYWALCESGSERELTTETNEITMETSLSTPRLKMTTISGISSTSSPEITQSAFETTTNITVLAVVAGLITMTIAVSVILIHHKRKRKRSQFNSRKSVITTNCYNMSWSG